MEATDVLPPSNVAAELRRIAAAIQNSKRPSRTLIARDVTTVLAALASRKDDILSKIPDSVLKRYRVTNSVSAGSSGQSILPANTNSPVFKSSDGHIVAFMDDRDGYTSAKRQMEARSDALPEVFEAEQVPEVDGLYVVVMEALKTLSSSEAAQVAPAVEYFEYPDSFGINVPDDMKQEFEMAFGAIYEEGGMERAKRVFDLFSPIQRAVCDLEGRSQRDGFWQQDQKADNMAWGKDGKLKYIDFGSISLLKK